MAPLVAGVAAVFPSFSQVAPSDRSTILDGSCVSQMVPRSSGRVVCFCDRCDGSDIFAVLPIPGSASNFCAIEAFHLMVNDQKWPILHDLFMTSAEKRKRDDPNSNGHSGDTPNSNNATDTAP